MLRRCNQPTTTISSSEIAISIVAADLAGNASASSSLVADLERLGILKEITGGKRGRMYTFEAYVKLFR